MQDQWNRTIRYARISLTNDCNLSCRYCRGAAEGSVRHAPACSGIAAGVPLSEAEFRRICSLLGKCGINRFKLTGGEPLLRQDLEALTEWLTGQSFAEEVTVTTNGTLLAGRAALLKKAGAAGVNVSVDTLDRKVYRQLTGLDCLEAVLEGVRSALDAGLRVRLNTVAMEGFTEGELGAFLELVQKLPADVRFISLMPVGAARNGPQGLSGTAVRRAYERMGVELQPEPAGKGNGPAVYFRAAGCKGCFGFIDALHDKFCSGCNRIRIGADGSLKPCLYDRESLDIRALLQAGESEEQLLRMIRKAIYDKPLCHFFEKPDSRQDERTMDLIGG